MYLRIALAAVAGCATMCGQAPIAAPISGFIFNEARRSIQPIAGLPGASYLRAGVATEIDLAEVAPDGSFALATRNGQAYVIQGLKSERPQEALLEGAIGDPEKLALSGSTAVIYSGKTGQVQIVQALPDRPRVSDPVDLSMLQGRISALAISGDTLILGVASPGGGLYIKAPGEYPRMIALAGYPECMVGAGSTVYFVDRSGELQEIDDFAEAAKSSLLASNLEAPVGLQLVSSRLFTVSKSRNTLLVYDLKSKTISVTLQLAYPARSISQLAAGSEALLIQCEGPNTPAYLVDVTADPVLYLIAAGGGLD